MSFLERADGRERVWNRNKEACGGGSFEQMKENVSYDAGHKHHLYFFFFFFSISSSTSSSTSSSPFLVPSLPLPLIVYSYFPHFHLHLDLHPRCSSQLRPPVRVFLFSYFSFCYSLLFFIFFRAFYFFFAAFPSFRFFFFIIRSFLFRLSFHFFSYYQARSKPSSIRASPRLLLAAHPGVRIAVIKFRRSLSMFA